MVSGSRQRLPTAAVPAARNEMPDGNDGDAANDRSDRSACSDVNIDDHAIATALQEEYAAAEARSSLEQDRIVPPEPVSKDHAIAAALQDKYIAAKTKEKSRGESEFQASSQPGALAADSDDHAIAAALQEEEEHLAKETKGKSKGKSASQPSIQTKSLAADSDDHAIAAALQEEFLKEAESEAAGSGATGASPAVSGSPDTALPALAPSPDLFAASPPVPNRRLVLQMAEKGREREQGQESEREREQERSLLDPALSPDLFAASPPVPNRRLVLQMAERGREREQEKDREREREQEMEQGREQAREQGQEWMSGRQADAAAEQADGFDNNDYDNNDASKGYKDNEGDVRTEQQEEELDGDLALAMELASEELSNAGLRSNEPPTAGRSITRLFTRSNSVLHSMRVNSGRLPSLRESLSSHQTLTERLAVYGLRELPMVGDGNCQFRALADQLFRNANRHAAVRQAVVQQMRAHSECYSPYVPDSFSRYLRHMARNGEWGDHITLQAAADKYGAKINLITSYPGDQFLIEIFPCQGKPTRELWLSFWAEVHYNSVYSAESLPPPQPKKKHWLFA
ncbi:unnamed protein product [Closterium sp. NIES-64]|nr:unnamed protein product [Closterium sp. NIES-64]CAI5996033.1 unnamed protein product [Closterium sp. NIES-65]